MHLLSSVREISRVSNAPADTISLKPGHLSYLVVGNLLKLLVLRVT